jgi:hypothetical protein
VLGNLKLALSVDPRPGADRKLSGEEEALLVAMLIAISSSLAPASAAANLRAQELGCRVFTGEHSRLPLYPSKIT